MPKHILRIPKRRPVALRRRPSSRPRILRSREDLGHEVQWKNTILTWLKEAKGKEGEILLNHLTETLRLNKMLIDDHSRHGGLPFTDTLGPRLLRLINGLEKSIYASKKFNAGKQLQKVTAQVELEIKKTAKSLNVSQRRAA